MIEVSESSMPTYNVRAKRIGPQVQSLVHDRAFQRSKNSITNIQTSPRILTTTAPRSVSGGWGVAVLVGEKRGHFHLVLHRKLSQVLARRFSIRTANNLGTVILQTIRVQ